MRKGRMLEPTTGIMDSQMVRTTEISGERGWDGREKGKGAQAPLGGGHVGVALVGGVGDGD